MTPDVEEWRPVPDYEGYEASNLGRVRSLDRVITDCNGVRYRKKGRILKGQLTSRTRHRMVRMGKYAPLHGVHQIVLWTFVGPTPEGLEVCHNNGIPGDNRLENLRFDTHLANMEDASRHGNHPGAKKTHCKRGHEFTPENTGRANKKRGRYCKTCVASATRARNARLDPAAEKARLHESYLRNKPKIRAREKARRDQAKAERAAAAVL